MSEPTAAAHDAAHAAHPKINYVRIWGILTVLLAISVAGPLVGIRWLTLITAFGIAIVKAYLVAKNFMHINLERRFVVYMVVTMLVLMAIFVGGVSPDVLKHEGAREGGPNNPAHWENVAANAWVAKGLKEAPPEEGEHGAKEGAEHH